MICVLSGKDSCSVPSTWDGETPGAPPSAAGSRPEARGWTRQLSSGSRPGSTSAVLAGGDLATDKYAHCVRKNAAHSGRRSVGKLDG